jgi:hypothetical protein
LYKFLEWSLYFLYFFFNIFIIIYFIFSIIYEEMYERMGIGSGENYRKDVLNYDKKFREWIEYIIKV